MYTYLLKLVSGNARGKPSQEAFLRSKNLCFLSFNEFEKSFRDRVLPMAVTREKSQGKKTLKDTQRTSRKRRRKKEEGYTGKCFLYIFPLFYPFLISYNNETTSTTTTMRTTTSTTPIIWRKRASLEEKHLALLYSSSSSSSSSFLSFFLSTSSESWKKYTAVYYPLLVRFLLDLGPSCLDKKNCYIHFFSFPSHLPSSNYGNGP